MTTTTNDTRDDRANTEATIPDTMTAVVARRYGGPEVLHLDTVPVPAPGPNDVLIAVEASSLNALDWHYLTGTPWFMRLMVGLWRPKRSIHGADVAGTVIGVGANVTDIAAGDRVFGETQGGGLAPYLTTAADRVAVLPPTVTAEVAAATPVAGLTALQALRTHADTQPGESVLINGAAGGVGTFGVQVAKALGARVTAVCSTRNVEMVSRLGADEVIDYTQADLTDGGSRFDVVVDNVGNRSIADIKGVLKPQGRYVMVSGPKDNRLLGPIPKIARSALAFRRGSQSFHQFTASPNRDDFDVLARFLADGSVVPEIQRVIGLSDAAEAMAEIGSGHARAKIIVTPG